LHRVRCWDCGRYFVTAEVVVPGARGISGFDEEKRRQHRDSHRRRRGYHGGEPRTGRIESDWLTVNVKVIPGRWRGKVAERRRRAVSA
jgi:hypothetical protein